MALNYPEFEAFITLVKANKEAIQAAILQDVYISQTATLTNKVALGNLIPLIDKIILPYIRRWEGGVSNDTAKDAVAVHGVTVSMVQEWFGGIFITQVDKIANATMGQGFASQAVVVNTDPTALAKIEASKLTFTINQQDLNKIIIQAGIIKTKYLSTIASTTLAMHALLADIEVAELFYYYNLTREAYNYPIAIMAADPYLGFLAADFAWTHGTAGKPVIDQATSTTLSSAGTTSLARIIAASNTLVTPTQGSKLPNTSREAIANMIEKLNKEFPASNTANQLYRQTYLDRLTNNPTESTLSYMVVITEKFNKNTLADYVFIDTEKVLLGNLAVGYEKFTLTVDL